MEETLKDKVGTFVKLNRQREQRLVALAEYYWNNHEFPGFVEEIKAKTGVDEFFLKDLESIALGRLYPPMLDACRGMLRLKNMPYDDQVAIIRDGVQVWDFDTAEEVTKRLADMTDMEVWRVVTPNKGKIRDIPDQIDFANRQHAIKMSFKLEGKRVRFSSSVLWTKSQLMALAAQLEDDDDEQ